MGVPDDPGSSGCTPGAAPAVRRRGRVGRLLAVVLWLSVLTAVAGMAFAYALPQRLTDTSRPYVRLATAAFFGRVFTFQVGLGLAAVVVLAIGLRRWRLVTVSAVAAALALAPTIVGCLPRRPPSAVGRSVRVLAMNVKYTNTDAADIVRQVRRFNPDVVTVEELAGPLRRPLDVALAADYPFQYVQAGRGIGLGIYSRLPFEGGPPQVSFGNVRRQLRAVVRVGDQPVALYVLHPLSPRSMRRVVANRVATADLVDQLGRETLPVVLAGDFNFTAETPNAAALTATGLTDAFDLAGSGRGSTWPVKPRWAAWLPGVRIDHVYLSPVLTCTAYDTGGYTGSDHYPIVADVAVAKR